MNLYITLAALNHSNFCVFEMKVRLQWALLQPSTRIEANSGFLYTDIWWSELWR
jgi:hypothetical protein